MASLLALTLGAMVLSTPAIAKDGDVAVVGGTLVDVGNAGNSTHDIPDAVVLIRGGLIAKAGRRGKVAIPSDSRIIDANGAFIVPGLIDGFGSLRNQHFADAYLFEGVTTVYVTRAPKGLDGEQSIDTTLKGPKVVLAATIAGYAEDGSVPDVHPWTNHRLHDVPLSEAQLVARMDAIAHQGARGVVIGFDVLPRQVGVIVREANKRHLATVAELAFTSYAQAVSAGVSVFMRNDRYETATASPESLEGYTDDPMGKGGKAAYASVCEADVDSPRVLAFARELVHSQAALMPVLSIEATADDVGAPNPWLSRSAVFVEPAELDDPVDAATNARPYLAGSEERRQRVRRCAEHRQDIDRHLHARGVVYMAGSGAPSYGILPGGGLHQELQLLQHIGLTPREALAAATGNFAEVFGWKDIGKIEPGRAADLLIVGVDPRRDVSALDDIRSVMIDGNIVDRAALQAAAVARGRSGGDARH
jgi:hypothetical protein